MSNLVLLVGIVSIWIVAMGENFSFVVLKVFDPCDDIIMTRA